jgi:dipeptidyl aminopeptidase/acylaminoacyl peptidase
MSRVHLYSGVLCGLVMLAAPCLRADSPKPFDAAAAFGARPDIETLRLSPDGMSVAFVTPIEGQGSVVYTLSLAPGSKPKVAFYADGKPFRMNGCNWVANDRLICSVYGLLPDRINNNIAGHLPFIRMYAVNADGTKSQQLSVPPSQYSANFAEQDSAVIDWLPDQDGSVLMEQVHLTDVHPGTLIGNERNDLSGLAVNLVNTRTLASKQVIPPRRDAVVYLSDGRGRVRILGERNLLPDGRATPETSYLYRTQDSDDWHELSRFNSTDHTGFEPAAVDHDLNIVYGWKKLDGRFALYSLSLDGALHEQLVYSRPDVDLGGLIRIGRRNRVVGVSYSTEFEHTEFFADDIKQLLAALHQALPQQPLMSVTDASADESKLLVFAGSDTDPGTYYILDRSTHALHKLLGTRVKLEGVPLARVKPITYPAADGQMIPAYLTLPPGIDNPRGLPAIVMPHGGPSARDQWGFDWLVQFYASRGYVVLQPNYRGSSGYGDAWFRDNGFKSWEIAVGDVVASGRWLVKEGIADPAKLAIVGWSYGGYAALQSVAVDPTLFKAIIAIAPVTDLEALKRENGFFGNYYLVSEFIGAGPNMRDGSPINHVDKFKQPVLLFHGTEDRNVSVEESRTMATALKAAGAKCDLVTFEGRDHQLDDSTVRADMLRQSDAFLRHSFGMSP